MQSSSTEIDLKQAIFIGETYLPWAKLLQKPGTWDVLGAALFDPNGKCPKPVQGQVKIYAKWIPVGHAESKFDAAGNPKEQNKEPKVEANYKALQKGQDGQLQIMPIEYTHPYAIKNPTKNYYIDMQLGAAYSQSEKSTNISV